MRVSPFLKQLYVALPPFFASLSSGGAVSYPMVLLQQLKAKDTTIELDFATASWMGSIHGLASILSIFMPTLMQWKGRKLVFITTCIVIMTGWVLAYFAVDATLLLIAESFHGFGTTSLLTVSCLTITEMMAPKYRDTFMQIFYIIQTVGMVTDGLLVQYCHWRTISIIMLVPTIISVIMAFALPESPYWLAYKGDIDKCKKNFVWLRGSDAASKIELNELINRSTDNTNSSELISVKDFWKKVTRRDFYVPAAHICVLQFIIYGSGSIATLIYSILILQNLTNDDNISVKGGLIMNLLFCVGLCVGIVLDMYFKKKSVLLLSICCASICLVVTSVFSYLQSVDLWPKESLVGLFCMSGFMFSSSVGLIGLAWSTAAALMPVKNRGIGGALMLINTGIFHSVSLKSAPYMFLYLNMWGTFLVYAAISICCGLLIWKYVPEIKDRSLQEIENYYKHGSYMYTDEHDGFTNMLPKTDK